MNHYQALENVTMFLLKETGSIWGKWSGRMTAVEQRNLFGCFLGKGRLDIDGEEERIEHVIKVCFGTDWAISVIYNLKNGEIHKNGERIDKTYLRQKELKQ